LARKIFANLEFCGINIGDFFVAYGYAEVNHTLLRPTTYSRFAFVRLISVSSFMVYANDQYQTSVVELARQGNLQALAYWLNALLAPYRLLARIDTGRSGNLRIIVELRPGVVSDPSDRAFRNRLVRYICHQLWKLNSPKLDGAMIMARYVGQQQMLWKQSVRIVSPARRQAIADSPQGLHSRIRSATRKRKQFQAMRSVLISGTSVAAFILGCWLGYADAPSEQTQATAMMSQLNRSGTQVESAVGNVAVLKPKEVTTETELSLLFGGDVSFGQQYDGSVGQNNQWSLGSMPELRQADVSMVNLDTPLTQAQQVLPGKKENFKASTDRVNVLMTGGIDVVSLANGRSMDYQTVGLNDTLNTLDKAGIAAVGAGSNAATARQPVIMDVKGQRVAYLSYYDSDLHAATNRSAGTNPRRNDNIAADIKAIRDQVNWVVVNFHWGENLAKYPGDWQIDLARFTIDQGADIVVGHHAKVLQGAEIYKGRPIAYSLGNFVFGGQSTDKSASDYDTAVLKVALKDKQMRVEFLPVEVRNFQARIVKGDRGDEILKQIKNVSDIFEDPLTGPMVLDAQSNTIVPPAEPINPAPTEPAPSHIDEPASRPSDATAPWRDHGFTEQQQQGKVEPPASQRQPKDAIEPMKRRFAQVVQPKAAARGSTVISAE
jgi:poly-gamma-glutamate synthesis protein (capsule biosynthesis protein)